MPAAGQLALLDVPPVPQHPARWSEPLLDVLRRVVPRGLVVDPMGGVGTLGRLGPEWTVATGDLEPEWARQAGRYNSCGVRWDARRLPLGTGTVPVIVTSPAYGNRYADAYAPPDYGTPDARRSHGTRRTYRLALGRDLSPGNGGGLPWGARYRDLHAACCREYARVLRPGGLLFVNVKDFYERESLRRVTAWWWKTLQAAGLHGPEAVWTVPLRGDQNTARRRAAGSPTVDAETIARFRAAGGEAE